MQVPEPRSPELRQSLAQARHDLVAVCSVFKFQYQHCNQGGSRNVAVDSQLSVLESVSGTEAEYRCSASCSSPLSRSTLAAVISLSVTYQCAEHLDGRCRRLKYFRLCFVCQPVLDL